MRIYKAPVVHSLIEYYGNILYPNSHLTLKEHLSNIANKMLEGLELQEECIYIQINNYNPEYN